METFILTLTVFAAQVGFIFLRTINVKFVSHDNMIGAITSGLGVGMLWIVTTSLGVASFQGGNYLVLAGHLAGGVVGTIIGMRKRKKHGKKN